MNKTSKTKKIINKQLVNLLMDIKSLDMISVNKNNIICTCSAKFKPADLNELIKQTGHNDIKLSVDGDTNYIIFKRF